MTRMKVKMVRKKRGSRKVQTMRKAKVKRKSKRVKLAALHPEEGACSTANSRKILTTPKQCRISTTLPVSTDYQHPAPNLSKMFD